MTEMFAIAIEPGFNRVIKRIDELAIEQNSNRSAITRDILYQYFGIRPKSKVVRPNRSAQLSRTHSGRR